MYNIGDKVLYPMHGAGIIDTIKVIDLLGKSQEYYVIKIAVGNLTVQVPTANADAAGIRQIESPEKIDEILNFLGERGESVWEDPNWNKRYRDNLERIRNGKIIDLADIVKTLTLRDRVKTLSTGERKMLSTARHILVSEISFVRNICTEDADTLVSEQLSK